LDLSSFSPCERLQNVYCEPDGNCPPDFLANRKVAVEVRRLNQNIDVFGKNKGTETDAIKLFNILEKLTTSLGPPTHGCSWYINYSFRRPLGNWKDLKSNIKNSLIKFKSQANHIESEIYIKNSLKIQFMKRSTPYPTFYLIGGHIDSDTGGWLVPQMVKNIQICIDDKSEKIKVYRNRYSKWWLALVDYVGHGECYSDMTEIRNRVTVPDIWEKVILINRSNSKNTVEL
jgi:hypothetical protein